jgi:hypothetical protein
VKCRRIAAASALIVVSAALSGAALLQPGCGSTESTASVDGAPDGGTQSGGSSGIRGSGGTSNAGGRGATGGSAGGGAVGGLPQDAPSDGFWVPSGDPEWQPLSWVHCKGALGAKNPEHAAPPLVWVPCEENRPGCQRMLINWARANPPFRPQMLTLGDVYKSGAALRYGLFVGHEGGAENMLVLYDERHLPIAAWSGPSGCSPWFVQASSAHVCMSFGGVPPATIALLPAADLIGTPIKTLTTVADAPFGCNADLYAGGSLAKEIMIRDLQGGTEHLVRWPNSATFQPALHGDSAFVQRWTTVAAPDGGGREVIDGWLWLRTNTLIKLVDPSPDILLDFRADGGTLAWVQSPTQDVYQPMATSLWTSPVATEPGKLVPRRVRDSAPAIIGTTNFALGGGYYAIIDGIPNRNQSKLHVYRLSDGKHWVVPDLPDLGFGNIPSGSRSVPSAILFLDSEEIWWVGMSQYVQQPRTIVRQRLDALGEGD